MTDLEKRAHDIAVRILPQMIEENQISYYTSNNDRHEVFNAADIVDEYQMIYEDILNELENQM